MDVSESSATAPVRNAAAYVEPAATLDTTGGTLITTLLVVAVPTFALGDGTPMPAMEAASDCWPGLTDLTGAVVGGAPID